MFRSKIHLLSNTKCPHLADIISYTYSTSLKYTLIRKYFILITYFCITAIMLTNIIVANDIAPEVCYKVMKNIMKRAHICYPARGGHLADVIFHIYWTSISITVQRGERCQRLGYSGARRPNFHHLI